MSYAHAAPSCTIECYPFEGGPFVLTPGQIRDVLIEKDINGGSNGRAVIQLAPGGPYGPESSPTWIEIMTPMSHVLIGLSRGGASRIVFDGIVTRADEAQEWQTNEQTAIAGRFPVIEAVDFAYFFNSFNWYALSFLGLTASVGSAGVVPLGSPAGVPYVLDKGLIGGASSSESNPAILARKWYEEVMTGQDGILGKTFVPYKSDSAIYIRDAIRTIWENFPNAFIPYADNFMADEQTWMEKFLTILPFPWYEFFITTGTVDDYPLVSGATATTGKGTEFTMSDQPAASPAGPILVARINPAPSLAVSVDASSQNSSIGDLDTSRWVALPLKIPDLNFYESVIEFNADSARNFYIVNPTAYSVLFGDSNNNITPFPFRFIGAYDAASVHRYGFHPQIGSFKWMYDPTGSAGENSELNIPQTVGTMLGKYMSWFHPAPLMARATSSWPLMPDVLIGTRIRYAPFKDGKLWDFYIDTVRHHFVFGGRSTTTLGLSRGLPQDVYQDKTLLKNVVTGNAVRQSGVYKSGIPASVGPALTTFGPPDSINTMVGNLAHIFVTPQATTTDTPTANEPDTGNHGSEP